MKKWKLVLLITAAVVFVGAAGVYGVQSSQNKAIALEQAVEIAESVFMCRKSAALFTAEPGRCH